MLQVYVSDYYDKHHFVNEAGVIVRLKDHECHGFTIHISSSDKFWAGTKKSLTEYLRYLKEDECLLLWRRFKYNTTVKVLNKKFVIQGKYDRCWCCDDGLNEKGLDEDGWCYECEKQWVWDEKDLEPEEEPPEQEEYCWEKDLLAPLESEPDLLQEAAPGLAVRDAWGEDLGMTYFSYVD
jgi:hypothetical protein